MNISVIEIFVQLTFRALKQLSLLISGTERTQGNKTNRMPHPPFQNQFFLQNLNDENLNDKIIPPTEDLKV